MASERRLDAAGVSRAFGGKLTLSVVNVNYNIVPKDRLRFPGRLPTKSIDSAGFLAGPARLPQIE